MFDDDGADKQQSRCNDKPQLTVRTVLMMMLVMVFMMMLMMVFVRAALLFVMMVVFVCHILRFL